MSHPAHIRLKTAALLVLLGLCLFAAVMTCSRWDFSALNTVAYETNTHSISQPFQHISLATDTANILLLPSEDHSCRVVCYEPENAAHSVTVQNDTLTICAGTQKKWYNPLNISFDTPSITIYLPPDACAIDITATTGDVRLQNLPIKALDITVSTGKIHLSSIACEGPMRINVSTGRAELTDVTCQSLFSDGSTGRMTLTNVIASETISIERSTGDITLDHCDAPDLFFHTSTGDVKGTLLTEKTFLPQTSTGQIDVPSTHSDSTCQIETSTGDISIRLP